MATYAQQANSGKDAGSNGGGGSNSYSSSHNNNNKSSDGSKKEEFRNYLEKSGVLDTLTKVLVGLYEEPERPSNAIEYIKRYLGAPKNVDVIALQRENEELRRQLAALSEKKGTETKQTTADNNIRSNRSIAY
ncbi:unnamed protein product [Pseudo-nitzschia multistriata]|uniref:c-Myc-binding protein n=1 Tax=Pseudo-nitzschia multistriata TaxID=183589 RepID=A0A448ZNB6_9STRA|nr:unnamed protein product [Pseudo-nitzschia multistriata]